MNSQTIQEMIDELKFMVVVLQRELKKTKKDERDNDPFLNPKETTLDIDKIMAGYSYTTGNRELMLSTKEAIKSLADDNGRASYSKVLDYLVDKKIDREAADKQLQMLMTCGELMDLKGGLIKLI